MLIEEWMAYGPAEFSDRPYPMICLDTATHHEYELANQTAMTGLVDGDLPTLKTFIWYQPGGEVAARRIAQELTMYGFAFLYPGDDDLAIQVSSRHCLIAIGCEASTSK